MALRRDLSLSGAGRGLTDLTIRFSTKEFIGDIQRAQAANNRIISELKPRNAYGEVLKNILTGTQSYAQKITHVDTGGLKASHRIKISRSQLRGEVFLDPGASRSDGGRPAQYGFFEHERGGTHAFYRRTVKEAGNRLGRQAIATLIKKFPR